MTFTWDTLTTEGRTFVNGLFNDPSELTATKAADRWT
jgi:hypothetical protein